jgi:hypothetical protein
MKRVRTLLPAGVVLAVCAALAVAGLGSGAGAQTPELPGELADQQDVRLNANGQATVRFDQGDPVLGAGWDTCMIDSPIVSIQLAATLTAGKPQPRTWSARFNSACSFVVAVFDANNRPITNATVRLGYIAIAKGAIIFEPPTPANGRTPARRR